MAAADAKLTVYSDYVCPFCYLGRRSLERYEADRGEPVEIDWHPFDLRSHKRGPDGEIDHGVDDGKDESYYEQAKENVRRLQERYDVEMTLDLATDIDSLAAQVVSYHLKDAAPADWRAFDEAVFEALWVDGRDIGDREVLRELAADVGIDPDAVDTALDDDALREELHERFQAAQRDGVTGVPTFAYDGYAARGAVPPDQLRRLIEGP
ncbi:MAG: DsbA family oxidoreductase [Halobacteriales archaeon]|nr:DsbA family oxidoreductase [Halobacteriales archaeon]